MTIGELVASFFTSPWRGERPSPPPFQVNKTNLIISTQGG
jgi:hypothetical protein